MVWLFQLWLSHHLVTWRAIRKSQCPLKLKWAKKSPSPLCHILLFWCWMLWDVMLWCNGVFCISVELLTFWSSQTVSKNCRKHKTGARKSHLEGFLRTQMVSLLQTSSNTIRTHTMLVNIAHFFWNLTTWKTKRDILLKWSSNITSWGWKCAKLKFR